MKKKIVIELTKNEEDCCHYGKMYGLVGNKKTDQIRANMNLGTMLSFYETQMPKIEQWMEQIR